MFDPITLEILWRRIISIVDEADATVARTAFSSLLRDAHDYTCILTDTEGRLLAQGSFCTPGQAGAMMLGVREWVQRQPKESYRPGDVFITNDPWLLAGHLNDVCVMSPIFQRETLLGFTACVFHHSDIGGRVASDNRDVFEEGLFIPPTRLYEAGVFNDAILDLIRWNVRTPEDVVGDIRSQVAANYVCSEKVLEMVEAAGLVSLDDLASQITAVTEKSMRDAIAKIPDGAYVHAGVVEGPGTRGDIEIKVTVQVKGSDIIVDLAGSSPEVDWGGNVVYNFSFAYVYMAIKSAFNPDTPNNEGSVRPITLKAPEGSVVNCRFPAPVGARLQVGHFLTEMVFKALAPAAPDRIIAPSGGTPAWMQVFYGRRHDGRRFHSVLIRGGGMGANHGQDGRSCVIFPANGANTPCEIFESDTPLIMEKRELLRDSGGAGKMRGGLGRQVVFRVPDGDRAPSTSVAIGIQGGRFRYAADGLFGGGPGSKSRFLINGEAKDPGGLNLANPGDTVVFHNPGGGGYGDPFERDPERVVSDVVNGYVSPEMAREEYGVAIDSQNLSPDLEATQRLRKGLSTDPKPDSQ